MIKQIVAMNTKFLNNHHFNFSKFFYRMKKIFAIDFALNLFENNLMFINFDANLFCFIDINSHSFSFSFIEKSELNIFESRIMFVNFDMSIFYSMKSNLNFFDQIFFSKNCLDSKNAEKLELNFFDSRNLSINFDEFLSYQKKINFFRIYVFVKIVIENTRIFMKKFFHMRLSRKFDLHNIDQLSCWVTAKINTMYKKKSLKCDR